jgi:sulfate adenylyltransferase subunit 2
MIVAFSAGKDSLCVLDLCMKRFKKVRAYFMYHVKDLDFQEVIIRNAERRYAKQGLKIDRVPHFALAGLLTDSSLIVPNNKVIRKMKITDIETMMRDRYGIDWLASGETKYDSIERRGMLGCLGPADVRLGQFDAKRRRYFPIADWNRATVFNYMKANNIPTPAFYKYMRSSFGRMRGDEMQAIYEHYPSDYKKIIKVFPLLEAVRQRDILYAKDSNSDITK